MPSDDSQAEPTPKANVQFCNSKSIELFGFDPTSRDSNSSEKTLNSLSYLDQPRFIPLGGNINQADNDIVLMNGKKAHISLKSILLEHDPSKKLESYLMIPNDFIDEES